MTQQAAMLLQPAVEKLELHISFNPSALIAHIPRREDEPYLRYIERQGLHSHLAEKQIIQLNHRLDELGFTGEVNSPNANDEASIYLAKTARRYLLDCLDHHAMRGGHDPKNGVGKWLVGAGRLWDVNDAMCRAIVPALYHSYTHATADIEATPRLSVYELCQRNNRLAKARASLRGQEAAPT